MNDLIQIRNRLQEDLSLWSVDAPRKDVFMIGNGRVSAVLGWGERLTELGWVLGPYYENSFNRPGLNSTAHFGTQTARLLQEPVEVEWSGSILGRARQTCVMLSRQTNIAGLRWDTIDYCCSDKDLITRIMIFENAGNNYLPEYKLELGWKQPDESKKLWSPEFFISSDDTGNKLFSISVKDAYERTRKLTVSFNVPYETFTNTIAIKVPSTAPGSSFVVIQSMSLSASSEFKVVKVDYRNTLKDLSDTIKYWTDWSNYRASVKTSEPWFDDLLDAAKIWCKVQQSVHGVFTPMIFYSDAYVRDCNGPLRLFLRLGMFKEVQGVLEFFKKAAVYNRLNNVNEPYSGVNNIRLDVDNFPEDSDIDWSQVDPGKAEIPSWIILWNWWYFVQTGDAAYIEQNWSFLVRCLESQKKSVYGFICFHGDETYKYLGVKDFTGVDRHDYVSMFETDKGTYSSFESTVLFMYAFDAMRSIALKLGKVDSLKLMEASFEHMLKGVEQAFWDSTDNCYRMAYGGESEKLENPHAIVLSTPCWLDAFVPAKQCILDHERKKASWQKSLDFLEKEGWINASPYLPVTDGHLPGFMLSGAAIYEPAMITYILEKVKRLATPAGGFAEYYSSYNAEGARGYHGKAWGRLRPWESGINLEAMIFSMTGFSFEEDGEAITVAPRLPEKWDYFELRHFNCLNTSVSLRIERKAGNIMWTLINEGDIGIRMKAGNVQEARIIDPGQSTSGMV